MIYANKDNKFNNSSLTKLNLYVAYKQAKTALGYFKGSSLHAASTQFCFVSDSSHARSCVGQIAKGHAADSRVF